MSDLSVYAAGQFIDWLTQGSIDTPPSDIYVTVFDSSGTELDGDFQDARTQTAAGSDWTKSGTDVENANNISLGQATSDVTDIEEVALYDAATGGNLLARYTLSDNDNLVVPFDVSQGTVLAFEAGQLTFDVVDRTE